MALAQLLANHSRDLTATINHQNSVKQDNVDRKANDLEEKFQHVKDSIEGAGGEITALAGAYHMGRKIYQKVQAKRAELKAKANNPTQSDGDGRATDASQNSGAPEPEAGTEESGATTSADAEDARTTQAQATEEAQPDAQPIADEPAEATQPSAGAGEDTITDETENIGGGSRYQLGDDDAIPGSASKQPSGDLSRNLASDDSPQTTIAKTGGVDDSNSGLAKVGELADPDAPGEGMIQRGLTKVSNVGDDLMGGVRNVGKKIASKVGATIGEDALSGGLETASTVLDTLGPIGEVAGVITGLVGLFEGIGHKKKDVGETGQEATSSAQVSAGVDTSALTEQSAQSVGTQV